MPTKKKLSVSDAAIAVRAYERWMGRGCPSSDGNDDWFAARQELEAELNAPRGKLVTRKQSSSSAAKTVSKTDNTPALH